MMELLFIRLAEIGGPDIAAFEEKLHDQSQFVLWLYGAVFVLGLILLLGFTLRIQDRPLSWSEPVRRLEWRPWSIRSAACIVIPLLAIQVVFGVLYYFFGDTVEGDSTDAERALVILQSLLFHWLCFALIAASLYIRRLPWSTAFGFNSRGILREAGWGILILIGVMPLLIGYNFIAHMVMNWLNYTPTVQDVTRIMSDSSNLTTRIYFALLAVVIAPIVEEMLFRGILLPAITRMVGVRPAIVFVSVLFAMVHGHLPSAVPLFILSVSLCLAYIYRGSLFTNIAMHSFFNSLTIAVILRM
jgi:membrane protease YdiL (CAAX protease family)